MTRGNWCGVAAACCAIVMAALGCVGQSAMASGTTGTQRNGPSTHMIVLQHVDAANLIGEMGWYDPSNLPSGVESVTASRDSNSLSVTATDAGLASIQEALSIVDVPRRTIDLRVTAIAAKDTDLTDSGIVYSRLSKGQTDAEQIATGPKVAALLASLRTKGEVVVDQDVKTTNLVPAMCEGDAIVSALIPSLAGVKMSLIPTLQNDGAALQIDLATRTTFARQTKDAGPITVTTDTSAEPTVKSGDTVVLRGLFRTVNKKDAVDQSDFETGPFDAELMVFLTPTVITR